MHWHRDRICRAGYLADDAVPALLRHAAAVAYPSLDEGFALLPGVIVDQHFLKRNRVNRLLGVLARYPGYAGLGIDEQTAVVIRGRRLSVVGNSYALLCLADEPPMTPPRASTAWKARSVAVPS